MKSINKSRGAGGRAVLKTATYVKSGAISIIIALVLAALSAVLTIIGPDKVGDIANEMSNGLFTGIDLGAIAETGIFLAVIYTLSAVFGFIQQYIMATARLCRPPRVIY